MSWKHGLDLARVFHLVVEAIDAIGDLASEGKDPALRAIAEAVGHLKAGVEGKASVEAVEHALADLKARLQANDTAADEALRERFRADP